MGDSSDGDIILLESDADSDFFRASGDLDRIGEIQFFHESN